MSTLQLTISSDEEDNVANLSKRGGSTNDRAKDDEVSSDEEDEMDDDFEFGGLMVCVFNSRLVWEVFQVFL
jgi:hypothetical protein